MGKKEFYTNLSKSFLKKMKPRRWYFIIAFIFAVAVSTAMFFFIFYQLPSPYSLKDYKAIPLSSHIYDRNGKLLYEVYKEQNRTPIQLKSLPPYVAQATIAIEDKDFYNHAGISIFSGILRAMKEMVFKNQLQGGSTITQQLVKSALLTPERTLQRKIKEIVLALWTERIFNKSQILEMYLNQVPYGGSSYGIEEASKTYFGKHAAELSLDESALLAGLPQAPSLYSPFVNPDLTVKRRNEVLQKMYEQKYIDKTSRDNALAIKLEIALPQKNIKAPHFVMYIKSKLEEIYGIQHIEKEGLRITTTLDLELQEESEKILKEELEKIKNLNVSNGAILVTRPPTGEILAMVGSVDYFATPSGAFNVTTALRQPGSAIKPINYAIGLERKLVTPATVFLDMPTCFTAKGQPDTYCPVNYDEQFHGPVQLRFALGNSYNIPAVKMLALNGVENFVASSSAFTLSSITDPKRYGLSLTLGGADVRMIELAQAFSAFPNRGIPKPAVSILSIKNKLGKTLFEYRSPNFVRDIQKDIPSPNFLAISGEKVISQETAFLISHILLDNNARSQAFGSFSYLNIPKHAVSVKTGTTDDKRDNWTIGYTPNFLTAVWVGNNDNTPMNPYLSSGVTGAAPIWNTVMKYVLKNQPDLWPLKPETVVGKQVCSISGELMGRSADGAESCPSRFEYFLKDTEPKTGAASRQMVLINKDTDQLAFGNEPNTEMREKTIVRDMFSMYCLDCNHEKEPNVMIRLDR